MQLALIGGAGEIGRSLSQMLKQSSKLDVLALYDVAALNKRFSTPIEINKLCDSKITNTAVRFLYSLRGIYIYIRIHIYIYTQHGSREQGKKKKTNKRMETESRRKFTMNTGIREFTTNYCYYPTRKERGGKVRSSSERSTLSRSRRKIATRRRKEAAAFHVRAVLSYIYRYESYTIENPRDPSRGEEKEKWEEKEKEGGRRGRTTSRRNARESERERE